MHNSSLGGHSGMQGTYHRMKKLLYRPRLKEDVHEHVRNYETCQIGKSEHIKAPGLLQPLEIPKEA
jgi:Integrase zinc binding domain